MFVIIVGHIASLPGLGKFPKISSLCIGRRKHARWTGLSQNYKLF